MDNRPRVIHVDLIATAFYVVQERTGKSRWFVNATYRKWKAGAAVVACVYGKEKPIAIDCVCDGCIESLCYLFFDTVQNKVALIGLTPLSRGFD